MKSISDINHIDHDANAWSDEGDLTVYQTPNRVETAQHQALPEALIQLFTQLNPHDVEQFYKSYQLWTLRQQIESRQLQIAALQKKIEHNAALMERVRPSSLALSILAQLQASGVEEIDLLDQMLARGETWLDHTMQQLAYCERFDLIGESHTQWCKHALEGAYDWIDSIQETESITTPEETSESAISAKVTENLLLQKLMSENETEKQLTQQPKITAPLPILAEISPELENIPSTSITTTAESVTEREPELLISANPETTQADSAPDVPVQEQAETLLIEGTQEEATSITTSFHVDEIIAANTDQNHAVPPEDRTEFDRFEVGTLPTEETNEETGTEPTEMRPVVLIDPPHDASVAPITPIVPATLIAAPTTLEPQEPTPANEPILAQAEPVSSEVPTEQAELPLSETGEERTELDRDEDSSEAPPSVIATADIHATIEQIAAQVLSLPPLNFQPIEDDTALPAIAEGSQPEQPSAFFRRIKASSSTRTIEPSTQEPIRQKAVIQARRGFFQRLLTFFWSR